MTDFDESDYEVPNEVLKKLQDIEEWRPGYVPTMPSASASLELNEMAGGGLSSSMEDRCGVGASAGGDEHGGDIGAELDVEYRPGPSALVDEEELTDATAVKSKKRGPDTLSGENRRPENREEEMMEMAGLETGGHNDRLDDVGDKLSQPQSEAMSLGSDDWDMHSVESIGLSTEEQLLADSQEAAQVHPEDATQDENSTSVVLEHISKDTTANKNSPNKNSSPALTKRKRQLTSVGSASKIPRRDGPEHLDKEHDESPPVFQTSLVLSPIRSVNSQGAACTSPLLRTRSQDIRRNKGGDENMLHSTPVNNGEDISGTSEVVLDTEFGPVETDVIVDKERSGPDLFESAPDESSCKSQQVESEGRISHPSSANSVRKKKRKQLKVVQFDNSVLQESDRNRVHANDKDTNSASISKKPSDKLEKGDTYSSDDSENSVEILNVSAGFETSEFYKSPSSPGISGDRRKPTRLVANLRSPQIPASIPTPINSLPSHQPRQLRSASQSSANSTSMFEVTNCQQEVDPDTERLSAVKLEDELLQWCTRVTDKTKHEKRFNQLGHKTEHKMTHTGKKPHKCQYCEKRFTWMGHKTKHEMTHTGEKPHKCQYCEKRFTRMGHKTKHEMTHTGEKPHKCQYCGKRFTQIGHKTEHEMTHTGEKPHKCQYCGKKFTDIGSKTRHEMTHTGEKPHKCQYCGKRFTQIGHKTQHEMTHTGEKPHKCQYCEKLFTLIGHKTRHEMSHTGEKPHKCQYCKKRFTQIGQKTAHEMTHTGEKPYKCQYCGKKFTDIGSKTRHEMTHTGEKPHKCQYCEKRFTLIRDKTRHEMTHEMTHTGGKPHKCQYCGKKFTDFGNKTKHEMTHTGEKPHKCQYCEKRFTGIGNKTRHEMTHTGEKPHKCQYCEKRFTWMGHKTEHEMTHTGEKPHKCQYCGKRFTQIGNKTKHEKIHTGEKPHKCQYCEKRFTWMGHKTEHEMTHTGEKPHKCQYCGKRFIQIGNKTKHEKIHTGEKPHKCQYCEKRFIRMGHKTKHEMIHIGEKLHKCQYCEKGFTRMGHKTEHEMIHEGEKPHKCQYCEKMFTQFGNKTRHEMTHTGEKPRK
ncbi:uncharacterized protein [Amphiura filiformis]|uniref:uncharacterized protein n=1 Tax=Amphiura filiformis TaxID=82378 RepID=UPI003B214013